MTDPSDPQPAASTEGKIIDSGGKELTKPAPKLIIPATVVAIALCGLFLLFFSDRGEVDEAVEAGGDDVEAVEEAAASAVEPPVGAVDAD